MRLDRLLVERGLEPSRERARRLILAGSVRVDGRLVDKAGAAVADDAEVEIIGPTEPFVSRAGRKLAAALDHFGLDPDGWTCLDVGASTGGFCDCLLQRGARRVWAVDVGYGQLDYQLRQDPRVEVFERCNARHLEPEHFGVRFDLVTVDVSFISLRKVVPALVGQMTPEGYLLPLVKPQFEAPRGSLAKGGILRDESLRAEVLTGTVDALRDLGLECLGLIDSEVSGVGGNVEAFALLVDRNSKASRRAAR